MENLVDFEESNVFFISVIGLAVCLIFLYLNHIIPVINLYKNKERLDNYFKELSCIHIFAQLIFSSLFFCLLNRFNITKTRFLTISNLIGIVLTTEWLMVYLFFYHYEKIIFAIIHMLLPLSLPCIILPLILMIEEINKTIELVLINLTFIFYIFMFISPGINIVQLFTKKNVKVISSINTIIGILVNIFMIFFLSILYNYNIISIIFIVYPIISLIICIFFLVYYCINKENNILDEEEDKLHEIKSLNLLDNNSSEA